MARSSGSSRSAAFWYGAISEISNLEAALVRSAVRSERKRVARDLHDGVVQELAYISTQAGWLLDRADGRDYEQPVRRIRDAVDRALDESRGAIAALNREMDEPLHLAVGNAAPDVATRVGVRLDLDLDPASRATAEWRDALIRIAREAVGNAVRHGGATEVRLALAGDPPVLTVADDGNGFDPAAPRSPQSFGLQSMRERAESLGGDFVLESTPGAGTTVHVRSPGSPRDAHDRGHRCRSVASDGARPWRLVAPTIGRAHEAGLNESTSCGTFSSFSRAWNCCSAS